MRIAVFCSSSPTIDNKYVELAYDLGKGIAESSNELVTGGGHISMMGAVSRGARDAKGRTVGVIPQALVDIEFADKDGQRWRTVGLSTNIIDASVIALADGMNWKLMSSKALV